MPDYDYCVRLLRIDCGRSTKKLPYSLLRSLSALQTWIWQRKAPPKESRGTLDQLVQVSRPGDKVKASLHGADGKTPCLHDSTRRLAQRHGIEAEATGSSIAMIMEALGHCLLDLLSGLSDCRYCRTVGLSVRQSQTVDDRAACRNCCRACCRTCRTVELSDCRTVGHCRTLSDNCRS